MSEKENNEDINKSNDNHYFGDDEFIIMNKNKNYETISNNECKNDLFLKKINKNILAKSSAQNIRDNTAIFLNKDSLYETFSLFQQFLNTSKVENNNNGKIDQKKIGEQIKQFLERKRQNNFPKNINKKNLTKDKIKKEKKNIEIKTKLVKSVDNLNKYKKNKDKYNTYQKNKDTKKNNDFSDSNKKTKNEIKAQICKRKNNLLLSNSKEKYFDSDKNLKNIYNIDVCSNINKNKEITDKNALKVIIKSKSTNNILENKKDLIIKNFKIKLEKKENKNNDNKIMKTNSFSKNMKDIIKNKLQNNKIVNKEMGVLNRNKKYQKKYNRTHSNSCALFLKNTFLDNNNNNLNISPYSFQKIEKKKTFNNINKVKLYNRNNTHRNGLIFPMKKMIDSKSEKKYQTKNFINKFNLSKDNNNLNQNNNLDYKKEKHYETNNYNNDNININLNINQEINNINYSSEKPTIETNYQKLIKIKKNIENQDRNNNFISSGYSYNKSLENVALDNFNNKNNNSNIIMTEIKVKKKKNISSKDQIIKTKIKELTEEIEKFKEERNKITLLKNEYEILSKKLMKDIEEFNNKKEEFEKYKQNEIESIKSKKIIPLNQSLNLDNNSNKVIMSLKAQNQTLIQNNKKDKETIKSLKMKIIDLENTIKQKDNEIKKMKNNNIINSHKELLNNKKINEQFKNNKNLKSKKDLGYDLKKLFEKKFVNNDSIDKKDINNYTANNFSKVYFDNINKNILKIKQPDMINISFIENQKTKKIKEKFSLKNNTNKIGNVKSNNIEFNKVIQKDKKIDINNEDKLSKVNITNVDNKNKKENNLIINCTERNLNSKKINLPKITMDYSHEIIDIGNIDRNNINFNTCNAENNIFKNIKRIPLIKKPVSQRSNNIILSSNKLKNNKTGDFKFVKQIKKIKKVKTIDIQKNDDKKEIVNISKESKDENIFNDSNNKIKENQNDNNLDFIIINNDLNNEGEDDNQYDFVIPDKYMENNYEFLNTVESDGKKINIYSNNKKEIIFKSGVRKEIFDDGYQLVHFPNGDMKQTFPNNKQIYYFNEAKTVQTAYLNGLNIFKFNNNQIEKHYPDGSKFIIFPNGSKRKISKEGIEEYYISDEESKIFEGNNNKIN